MFYDEVKKSDLGSRAYFLKNIHGIMIFGTFKKIHEGILWRGHRALIYFILTKKIFLHIYRHRYRFYNRYINKTDKNHLHDDVTWVKPFLFTKRNEIHIWL